MTTFSTVLTYFGYVESSRIHPLIISRVDGREFSSPEEFVLAFFKDFLEDALDRGYPYKFTDAYDVLSLVDEILGANIDSSSDWWELFISGDYAWAIGTLTNPSVELYSDCLNIEQKIYDMHLTVIGSKSNENTENADRVRALAALLGVNIDVL